MCTLGVGGVKGVGGVRLGASASVCRCVRVCVRACVRVRVRPYVRARDFSRTHTRLRLPQRT